MDKEKQLVNSAGAKISPRGYVLCNACGRELQGVSKETAPHWAQCLSKCKPLHVEG